MELWIRSQDKECLMKVDRLDYDLSNYKHRIMANGYQTLVAEYETKVRALKVLDEIENFIYTEVNIVNSPYEAADIEVKSNILCNMVKIFEMPEK